MSRIAELRIRRVSPDRAITFVQRFSGLVNLTVHFHLLVPDGVFTETDADLPI